MEKAAHIRIFVTAAPTTITINKTTNGMDSDVETVDSEFDADNID